MRVEGFPQTEPWESCSTEPSSLSIHPSIHPPDHPPHYSSPPPPPTMFWLARTLSSSIFHLSRGDFRLIGDCLHFHPPSNTMYPLVSSPSLVSRLSSQVSLSLSPSLSPDMLIIASPASQRRRKRPRQGLRDRVGRHQGRHPRGRQLAFGENRTVDVKRVWSRGWPRGLGGIPGPEGV